MKRYILFFIIFLATGVLNAQGLRVESSSENGLKLHYSIQSDLHPESHYIAVPNGATVCMDAHEPENRSLSDIVTIQPTTIRSLDVVLLSITPYIYDSIQKTLETFDDIDINIRFEGGDRHFGDARYLNPDWHHILSNMVINKEMLPESDYYSLINSTRNNRDRGCEYLIIAPDNAEVLALADTLKDFRMKQGILTKVVSLSDCGGNNTDNIRNYILNAYNNWDIPPAAVLIFGGYYNGYGIVPYFHYTIPDEYTTRRYPTDYPYCDMNGDSLPDLAISRITARNIEEYRTFVNKTIQYETNPSTDASYYDHPIIMAGHEDNKWFLLSSQSINGFYRDKLQRHPANFYMLHNTSAEPPDSVWSTGYNAEVVLDYFGPNGQNYIPEDVSELHEWITKTDTLPLHNAFNAGSFFTLYRGHSNFNAWWFPAFNTTSINCLVNEPVTFVYSVSCSTTLFTEEGRGMIDAFCIKEHGGAVGGIGAASLTHSRYNDILAWGVYDCIWPDFLPTMGGDTPPEFVRPSYALSEAKYYFDYHYFLPGWWINKENSTRHLFCYTGETYLNLFTEVPQTLQITHGLYLTENADAFTVTAEEGSVICISHDGEIIEVAQSNGQAYTFALPDLEEGESIILTATKQNHFRYEYEVPVISESGPYVVVENDGWLAGNGSELLHNGENVSAGLILHNYGNNAASNITISLSCESPFVEITQATCQTQTIAPGQTVTVNNAFHFNITDDIPDMTEVVFNINVNDGNGVKECRVTQHVAAPALMINPEITYKNGSNQTVLQLENSGNTDLHIQIANQGHFDSNPVNVYLEILAPFIAIDSPSRTFNTIEKESVQDLVFSIEASGSAGEEGWLMTRITLDDGVNETIIDTLLPFGGFNEAFDPEHFNEQNWQFSGNASWALTEEDPHSGEYCVKSEKISNNQSSSISITRETPATEISFFRKTSSEFNYDKLHFYIDNVEMGAWSGARPWCKENYALTEGVHTFQWTYTKDVSVSLGHDCAWIDDVNIYPEQTTIAYSGDTLTVCQNENVYIGCSYAYNYHNLEWTTSGDGYFDDPHSVHTEYIPGVQDVNNGGATLQLTVDDIVSPLQLILTDGISLGDAITGDEWITWGEDVFSHYSVEAQSGIIYLWHLEPEDAGHIFAHGNEADIVWNFDSNISEATLTVAAAGSCSQSIDKNIHFSLLDTEKQVISPFNIFPNPTLGEIYLDFNETVQGKAFVEIFNLLGERVIVKEIHPLSDGDVVDIDLSRMASGIYIVKLNTEQGSFSQKVMHK